MLLVSSDRQTIHVFKLESTEPPKTQTWGGYFASFVPAAIGGYWTQGMGMRASCVACCGVWAHDSQSGPLCSLPWSSPASTTSALSAATSSRPRFSSCLRTGCSVCLMVARVHVVHRAAVRYEIVQGEQGPVCELRKRVALFEQDAELEAGDFVESHAPETQLQDQDDA